MVYVALVYDILCFIFKIRFKLPLMNNECYMNIFNDRCIFFNFPEFEKYMFLNLRVSYFSINFYFQL